jgi:hypothetical protein
MRERASLATTKLFFFPFLSDFVVVQFIHSFPVVAKYGIAQVK